MSQVRKLEGIISEVRISFKPKYDPVQNLAEEIESCKRKIWQCIDPSERKQYFEKKQKKSDKENNGCKINKENSGKNSQNVPKKVHEPAKVIQKAKQTKSKQPLTRADIEFKVFVMKVVELKKELKARGQDTNGLKKDLRNRLINVMLEDSQRQEQESVVVSAKSNATTDSGIVEKPKEEQKESPVSMDISEDSEKKNDPEEKDVLPKKNDNISQESQTKNSTIAMQVEASMDIVEQSKEGKKDMLTSSAPPQEQMKPVAVAKDPFKKPENQLKSIREADALSPKDSSREDPDGSNEKSGLTEAKLKMFCEMNKGNDVREDTGPPSEVSFCSKASGHSVKDMVSKFSGFSSSMSSSSGSALSKGLQAKKEARQAKIAEMRAKAQSKPVAGTKVALSSKEYSCTLSSLNAAASTASAKKNLATQMREKAAARAFQNKLTSSVPKTGFNAMAASSSKRHLPLTNNSNHSNNAGVQDSLGATLKQAPLIKKPSKVQSPMDTYEISDREDSDTDDSDSECENEKAKKKIPVWAQRTNLYAALQEQYNGRIGSKRVDPDEIFPEVQSCDLEAIFGPKKSKMYKRRASSGNWANDQVTAAEKLIYKREMGFATDTDVTGV